MPPILKSSIQKPVQGTAKTTPEYDDAWRKTHLKITETKVAGREVFKLYSAGGNLLGSASTRQQIEALRAKVSIAHAVK